MNIGPLQNEEVEEVIGICRDLYSRARFCVGVERLQLTCFLASIIDFSFLGSVPSYSCAQKKFVQQLCWNGYET